MSTQSTTYGIAVPEATEGSTWFKRAFDRMLAAGEAQGQRRVVNYLAMQSDRRLKEIGYTDAQIHQIRVDRILPTLPPL